MHLSNRMKWGAPLNKLTAARRKREATGEEILDLTESNPTRVALRYPHEELAALLDRAARQPYRPEPRGLASAREALARALSTAEDPVSPDDLVLTASTSEAYSFLFKLLADPEGEVLTPVPSYPLLDHLAALESVRLRTVSRKRAGARWPLDAVDVSLGMSERTRALVVVHPNNPTGTFVRQTEQQALLALCKKHGAALISDEVFYDYRLSEVPDIAPPAARSADNLSFSLGGLSKSAGLPHWKLGWIRVGGPAREKRQAIEGLDLIADSFLSIGTLVQEALPGILELAPHIRGSILVQLRTNLTELDSQLASLPAVERFPVEGGWSAVLRVPSLETDEDLAVALVAGKGVVVHPGYFFDFDRDGYLVLSLLPEPGIFAEGVRRLVSFARERWGA